MATQEITFDDLVQKVLHDLEFRKQLVKDPRAALDSIGVEVTDDMVEALDGVDYAALSRVAETFGRNEAVHPDSPLC